jgi:hypothetical protein
MFYAIVSLSPRIWKNIRAKFQVSTHVPVSNRPSFNSNFFNRFSNPFHTLSHLRSYPISHVAADAPICIECQALEMTFYDPTCKGCRAELVDRPNVGVPHVMAILRQWVPQVKQCHDDRFSSLKTFI